MALTDSIKKAAIKTALGYIEKDPVKNLPRLMDWADRFAGDGPTSFPEQRAAVRRVVEDPDCAMYRMVMGLFTELDKDVVKATFENFIVNANFVGWPQQERMRREHGCNIPWAILLDPTSACNLHCTGCWAAEYGNRLNLTFEEIDSIITQGKELGVYLYIYTGGEPLVRKEDLIRLCEKHADCEFLSFTNGTLIDDEFADELLRVGNFVPAISIEGFEEATDFRRGAGTYRKVIEAMERLRMRGLLFGISCCYTSKNTEVIGSEAFIDAMIDQGAKFAWLFTYMPIGTDAVPELIAAAEQRKFMYEKIREYRKTKPLFTMDFWNDGDAVGGCIAGGRAYLHINANGDVEPCAFIHYSDSNIREKPLLDCLRGPLFMAYRRRQPFNENMLRPCPVLDNPGALTEMVAESGARSTDLMSPEEAGDYCAKCEGAAAAWAPVAEELWANAPDRKGVRTAGKMAKKG